MSIKTFEVNTELLDIFGLVATGGKLVNLDEGINSKERKELYKSELHEISNLHRNSV